MRTRPVERECCKYNYLNVKISMIYIIIFKRKILNYIKFVKGKILNRYKSIKIHIVK